MTNLSAQAKRMIQVIIIFTIIVALGGIIYYRSRDVIPFLLGLVIGSLASLIRVLILENSVNRIIKGQRGGIFGQASHLVRLFIAFIALLIGALVDGINLFGVIFGILSYQIGTFFLKDTLTSRDKENLDEVRKKQD